MSYVVRNDSRLVLDDDIIYRRWKRRKTAKFMESMPGAARIAFIFTKINTRLTVMQLEVSIAKDKVYQVNKYMRKSKEANSLGCFYKILHNTGAFV